MDSREKATNPNPPFKFSGAPRPLSPEASPASGALAFPSFWGALLLVCGAFVWLYRTTLWQLGVSWSGDEYYSHGPLIPLISAYLIWLRRAELRAAWQPNTNAFWGLVWLLGGLGVAFFGFLTDINFVRAFSIPIVLLGLVRLWGGAHFQRLLIFPILLFAAGVPISRVVVQTFSVPLQKMAAGCASLVLGVMGLGVESDGVNIFTPGFNFVVDVPCSGLKTMTALLTVGLVVAYIVRDLPVWARVLLALSSLPVALLTNVIRILLIIQIGLRYGREAAEGFLHGASNIVTMTLSLAILLAFGHFLHLKTRPDEDEEEDEAPSPQATPSPQAAPPAPLAQPNSTRPPLALAPWARPSTRLVGAMVALLVGTQLLGASAIMVPPSPMDRRAVANLQLPASSGSGAWRGQSVEVTPAVWEMLRPEAAVQTRYTLGSKPPGAPQGEAALAPGSEVDVIVIYSGDSRGFHAPEICLRASGWTISDRQTRLARQGKETLSLTFVSGERKGNRTHLAYYFGGTESQATGWVAMLTREALGRITSKRTGSTEVQFAFGAGALDANGDFKPQLSALMLDVARSVQQQLSRSQAATK